MNLNNGWVITLVFITSMLTGWQKPVDQEVVNDIPSQLTEQEKEQILIILDQIADRDQQFRHYLSFGTTDERKIEELKKLDVKEQLKAMSKAKSELSPEVRQLLIDLQRRNDQKNHEALFRLVDRFGYPSAKRLGVESDRLFSVLLHPHVNSDEIPLHTKRVCEKLLPEVKAGRMPAKNYAVFVDNMRGKIQKQPQLYGTNQVFDRKSGKILPPLIEDIGTTNRARREIGLPELSEGEFRLVKS